MVLIFIKHKWIKEYLLFYVIYELWDTQSNYQTSLKANKWNYFSLRCIKLELTDTYAMEAHKVQINLRKNLINKAQLKIITNMGQQT